MAGTTHYQKLSLQLDAENKKLKDKLNESKKQISDLKKGTSETAKGFKQSFGEMGGAVGDARDQIGGLISSVGSLHPAILGLSAAVGAGALMWKDLNAYTKEWDGAISDAGRSLTAFRNGFSTFMEEAAEARGKALAEGGFWGWLKAGGDQLTGLLNGATLGQAGAFVGMEAVVNDLFISWQNGYLNTIVKAEELRVEQQKQFNIMRDEKTTLEDRQWAIDLYLKSSEELYKINKANAENEIAYLQKAGDVRGLELSEKITLQQKIVELAKIERDYLEDQGKIIRQTNKIARAEVKSDTKKDAGLAKIVSEADALDKAGMELYGTWSDLTEPVNALAEAMMPLTYEINTARESTQEFFDYMAEQREGQLEGWTSLASVIGTMANGIANAKNNWAAMIAVVAAGVAQMVPAIQQVITATKALFMAKQAEAMAGAAAAAQSVPFPGNLIAMATSLAAVAGAIAPFIGSFATGTDYVPQTGMALIHKGEAIIPAHKNRGNEQLIAVVKGSDLAFVLSEHSRRKSNAFG